MGKGEQLAELTARAEGPRLLLARSLQNFGQICSLFPSSPAVGRAMARAAARRPARHVVELGAGTGAVTRQLLGSGIGPADLTLIEIDPKFGSHLRRTFPELDVVIAQAQDIETLWRLRSGPPVGAVVSTLPIRLLRVNDMLSIMRASLGVLKPGGIVVQLTYRPSSPLPECIHSTLGVTAEWHRLIWLNLPPAYIWLYCKQGLTRIAIEP
jgi:phosphatidylethanolamine/phosphatidyl-N-methylethanolamine N-methyltransferase